ncbi:MAG: cytidine deaminase [Deltaproteobacteria bacterium HGW-Deltaproteobacteria-9]|jgi:dCMP deaminase|nr:MAG: cytidine deaminase [Deltaproteobacteria bacterium HGW-Deltaproteobacteria-9]
MAEKHAPSQDVSGKINSRPDWDTYFLDIVELVSKRATCLRRAVGAGLVRDRRILATGYNGAPSKLQHCLDIGCLREQLNVPSGERHELCRGLHAEQNAIIQAALHGVSTKGSTLYCTNHPCVICAKMIINAGITRIVIRDGYSDTLAADMLSEAGISVDQLNK